MLNFSSFLFFLGFDSDTWLYIYPPFVIQVNGLGLWAISIKINQRWGVILSLCSKSPAFYFYFPAAALFKGKKWQLTGKWESQFCFSASNTNLRCTSSKKPLVTWTWSESFTILYWFDWINTLSSLYFSQFSPCYFPLWNIDYIHFRVEPCPMFQSLSSSMHTDRARRRKRRWEEMRMKMNDNLDPGIILKREGKMFCLALVFT